MEKKKHVFQRKKRWAIISVVGFLLAIGAILLFLIHHLLQIQVPERLRYVKDYDDFTLSITEVPGCTNKVYSLFQYQNQIYNGVCIWDVTVHYGTVKAPLKMVLEEGYITLSDIQKKLSQVDEADFLHYEYRRGELESENYAVTISPKNYQNVFLTEITFEKYIGKEEVDEVENIYEDPNE